MTELERKLRNANTAIDKCKAVKFPMLKKLSKSLNRPIDEILALEGSDLFMLSQNLSDFLKFISFEEKEDIHQISDNLIGFQELINSIRWLFDDESKKGLYLIDDTITIAADEIGEGSLQAIDKTGILMPGQIMARQSIIDKTRFDLSLILSVANYSMSSRDQVPEGVIITDEVCYGANEHWLGGFGEHSRVWRRALGAQRSGNLGGKLLYDLNALYPERLVQFDFRRDLEVSTCTDPTDFYHRFECPEQDIVNAHLTAIEDSRDSDGRLAYVLTGFDIPALKRDIFGNI